MYSVAFIEIYPTVSLHGLDVIQECEAGAPGSEISLSEVMISSVNFHVSRKRRKVVCQIYSSGVHS